MVEGRQFVIYTDHKPLTFAFQQNPDKSSPRQFRHLDYIAQFTTDIRHVPGQDNVVADALSRINELTASIDYDALARAQESDTELKRWMQSTTTGLLLRNVRIPGTSNDLVCDVATPTARPYITDAFRKQAFQSVHDLAHPGINSTVKMVTQRFVWPSMKADCRRWARSCIPCQKNKISRHVSSPLGQFQLASTRFEHIHIDLVGPLTSVSGYKYCLTIVDRFTRWPEAVPLEDIEATTVAAALVSNWVARFGVPTRITSDQGRQFMSKVFQSLNKVIGSKHCPTTSYHPQANGMVERLHRQLKSAIRCHADTNWIHNLPLVLLGIRAAWKEDLHTTSAELVYGENIRLPGEFLARQHRDEPLLGPTDFVSQLRRHLQNIRPTVARQHGTKSIFVSRDLATTTHVFVRHDATRGPLHPFYNGPYEVITRNDKFFTVKVNEKNTTVSIDRLKPAYILSEDLDDTPTGNTLPPTTTTPDTQESTQDAATKTTRSGRRVRFPERYNT